MANRIQKAYDIDGHPDELMNKHWVCARCQVSEATLNRKLADKDDPFPDPTTVGRTRKWPRRVIDQYLNSLPNYAAQTPGENYGT